MAGLTDIVDFVRSKFSPQETEVVQEEVVEDFNQNPPEELTPSLPKQKPYIAPRDFTTSEWLAQNDTLDKRKIYTRNKLAERVKNPKSVVGILANIQGENKDFDWTKIQDLHKTGDELGEGIGIFQYDFMKDANTTNPKTGETVGRNYFDYLKYTNQVDSMDAQIDYAMDQIYNDPNDSILGAGRAKELREILDNPKTTAEQATRAFFRIFENPEDPEGEKLNKRLKNIKEFETKATGGMVMRDPYYNYNKQRAI